MVGRNPASARKYANVGPAIPQPEIKTELPVMSPPDLRSALTVTRCPPVSKLKGAWDDAARAYGEAMGEGRRRLRLLFGRLRFAEQRSQVLRGRARMHSGLRDCG